MQHAMLQGPLEHQNKSARAAAATGEIALYSIHEVCFSLRILSTVDFVATKPGSRRSLDSADNEAHDSEGEEEEGRRCAGCVHDNGAIYEV